MFSFEISSRMSEKDYKISASDYFEICNTSPQITHVHYDAYSNKFHIYTNDDYHWEFEVNK